MDFDRMQSSFAAAGAAAQHAAKQMAKLRGVMRKSHDAVARALARSIFESERSAVDRLADLVREDEDGA